MSTLVITHADGRLCDFLRKRFEMRGHRVVRAPDADSCLARCREERPDAILISLSFAGRNDFALLHELHVKYTHIPRMIIADTADMSDISDCKSLGCAFYIRRHFRSDALIQDIEHLTKGQTTLAFTPGDTTPYTLHPTP